jgi:hypothetical protein
MRVMHFCLSSRSAATSRSSPAPASRSRRVSSTCSAPASASRRRASSATRTVRHRPGHRRQAARRSTRCRHRAHRHRGAATLNTALQAAADQGAAGNYQPSTWKTLVETGPLTAAQLAANTVFARFPWLPVFPATLRPRFLRLLFSPAAATNFTAGTVAAALVTVVRDDQANKQAAKNFSVS